MLGISDEDETVVKPYLAQYGSDMAYTVALDPVPRIVAWVL